MNLQSLPALRSTARAVVLAVVCALLPLLAAPAARADTQVCDQYGTAQIQGGAYIVQNNEWGDTTPQCLDVTSTGFSITTANHNLPDNGAPGAYPSIYAGCHYGACTSNSGMPLQVSAFQDPQTSVSFNTVNSGTWDASYDVWFDTSPDPSGQNNGAELMIWGNHLGGSNPVGSKVGTADLAGAVWDVWEGPLSNGGITWNVVSYVRQTGANALNLHLKDFTGDSAARGYLNPAWYMTSVQFGFEPWVGGAGLGVNTFSVNAGAASSGGGGGSGSATTVVGQGSGRCLDVRAAGTADSTPVQIYDCNGTGAQQWQHVGNTFVNPNSGKCLDVTGAGTADGTPVQIYDCNGTGAQQWTVNSLGDIVNTNSGKCLDVTGQATADSTPLQIWDCDTSGQANQIWTIG
ncbi:glycoside hydrolase [Streptacidiphilus sp. PB12-B1b]|uniref:RICIN domain-containing protein n=1 Tax=Streptacidiphilus sp. PB12-B1b TaxID=2705012 RepID=UPI0015FA4E7A|nr:RICIN domain-containing protein [Streptacidiphilus sp. PB12-B1b]QMU76662.1 glycoside hydrolase [Streptacidiphilus sp. PB12-B1b]